MTNHRRLTLLTAYLAAWILCGCQDEGRDSRLPFMVELDPFADVNAISRGLEIEGMMRSGTAPATPSANEVQINAFQPSASISPDNVLFIPFSYSSSTGIAGVYLQVANADHYWDIPVSSSGGAPASAATSPFGGSPAAAGVGTLVLPVGIPDHVLPGPLTLNYRAYDGQGNVSNHVDLDATIVARTRGGGSSRIFPTVSGNDGLTVRSYDLGSTRGKVSIAWETYSVPDRIDVRYGGTWKASTGTTLDELRVPPILDCTDASGADGFVGSSGNFTFDLEPDVDPTIDVYVSGCLNGGTQWNFTVYFTAEANGTKEEWYESLPDCPCTYQVARNRGRETVEGGGAGEWIDFGSANQTYHYGAATEVRWAPDQAGAAGQQCMYDASGKLITAGIAAGTPDRVSPGRGESGGYWWSHIKKDVIPWRTRPCHEYLREWPANNGKRCRSNPVVDLDHMHGTRIDLVGNMTCAQIVHLLGTVKRFAADNARLNDFLTGEAVHGVTRDQVLSDLQALVDSMAIVCQQQPGFCEPMNRAIGNLQGASR